MKKFIYLFTIIAVFACTSKNEEKNLEQSDFLTDFTNARIQYFEESLLKSLSSNTDIKSFQKSFNEDLIRKETTLVLDFKKSMTPYYQVKSSYNVEEDTMLLAKMDEFREKIIAFDPNIRDNDEIIKQNFLSHLSNEKNLFIESVSNQHNLSYAQKEVLISQATYESGVISILSEYSADLQQLSSNKQYIGIQQQKVSSDCNWWCRNKKAIVCSGMSIGAAGCWAGIVYGCVPCVEYCASLTVAAALCWTN